MVLSLKNGEYDRTKNYFDKCYMPLVEIKDFNALTDNKPFFDQPVKNKQKEYEKLIEMSRNVDNNKTYIRLFKSSKILCTHRYRSIKANK